MMMGTAIVSVLMIPFGQELQSLGLCHGWRATFFTVVRLFTQLYKKACKIKGLLQNKIFACVPKAILLFDML